MLFLEDPAQRALVVAEQLPDALVAHIVVGELVGEELVLLADLGLRTHGPAYTVERELLSGRPSERAPPAAIGSADLGGSPLREGLTHRSGGRDGDGERCKTA
jgi:hypothetical protein